MEKETKVGDAAGCFYCANLKPFLKKTWSDASKNHFRTARIEFLKGVRTMVDERLTSLSRHEAKGTHVPVD